MAGLSRRARHGLILAIVGCLGFAMLAPAATSAGTDLVVGGNARVAFANGDDVRLREAPGYGAAVMALVPEGTLVNVLDGPVPADDGSFWYLISVDGQVGYMVADYLALDTGAAATSPAETVVATTDATTDPGTPPGVVIGIAVIAGTNGDGVRCRAEASTQAAVITVIPEGTTVELTGSPVDVWQPVNCAGRGGFVHSDFVSFGDSTSSSDELPATDEPPVIDELPATDEAVDTGPGDGSESFDATAITGLAKVVATNGGGLRCRAEPSTNASVLTILAEGIIVDLRGEASGEWQPVFCAGTTGFVHTAYISYDLNAGGPGVGSSTGQATIAGTNGDGLRCRSGASFSASVITVLPEGTVVSLRGAPQGEWQPVTCVGSKGFVHIGFLAYGAASEGGSTSSGGNTVTGTAVVSGTNGGGLRCRSGASFNAAILLVLREGSTIDLRGSAQGEWQPVFCAGNKGFVHVDYITIGGTSSGNAGSTSGGATSGGSNSSLVAGNLAKVSGTGGAGVRLRAGAGFNAAIITVVGEGTVVEVRRGSTGDWVAVRFNGSDGFIHMNYLVLTTGSNSSNTAPAPATTTRLSVGDRAQTSANLNLRYEASFSAGVAAVAPAGTVVEITGGPTNGFYAVNWDGLRGWMHGDYLSWTDAQLSKRGGSAQPGNSSTTSGSSNTGSGIGSAIVNYAMQYLGYPYVWATAGPSSFDCSGFTYWVVLNVLGRDIGRGLWTQVSAGTPVALGNLQPGDLVFFQNTYTWGLSHVGIYIGNGQFIHAENQNTGVRISDINSPYYSSRWYGAVRLA